MKRWFGAYLTVVLLTAVVAGSWFSFGTTAQQETGDERATGVAEFQDWASELEADGEGASTAIADLQTRVAILETAVASPEEVGPPVPAGSPVAGEILFEANAETGFDNWTEGYFGGFTNQFTTEDGILVAEEGGYTVLFAPYLTTSPDYILEAEIRLTPPGPGTPEPEVIWTIAGLAARYNDDAPEGDEGYLALTRGRSAELEAEESESLASISNLPGAGLPDPSDGWHTYRFELYGDNLRFLIDGVLIAEASDAKFKGYHVEGRVGVVASLGPLEVRAFRVIGWES